MSLIEWMRYELNEPGPRINHAFILPALATAGRPNRPSRMFGRARLVYACFKLGQEVTQFIH